MKTEFKCTNTIHMLVKIHSYSTQNVNKFVLRSILMCDSYGFQIGIGECKTVINVSDIYGNEIYAQC